VGGGVSSVADVKALLDAGADKVSVNSAAVRDPNLIAEIAAAWGRRRWCWPSTPSAGPKAASKSLPTVGTPAESGLRSGRLGAARREARRR